MSHSLVEWISDNILPHESDIRRWLRRSTFRDFEEDDVIQEAYSRLIGLKNFETVKSGRAYFFTAVRNVLLERLRRNRLVRIEAMAEIDGLCIVDDKPTQDRVLSSRQQLLLVQQLMENLPERCREIFKMRKVLGHSQRETARICNVSENVVEKQLALGLKIIMSQLAEHEQDTESSLCAISNFSVGGVSNEK